jgi:translation initiation factor 2-alpha kinase 4
VKARNILDGRTYAIKKVKLNAREREAIIDEVKTLARMVHKHVVRYYYSWIEEHDPISSTEKEWDEERYFLFCFLTI